MTTPNTRNIIQGVFQSILGLRSDSHCSVRTGRRTKALLAAWLALGWIGAVRAQAPPTDLAALQEHLGRVVRVTLQGDGSPWTLNGRLRAADEAGLRLGRSGGDLVELPVTKVVKVELLPRGRWLGLAVGAAVWGAVAYGSYDADERPPGSRSAGTLEGMLAGATVGALLDLARQPEPQVIYERPQPSEP